MYAFIYVFCNYTLRAECGYTFNFSEARLITFSIIAFYNILCPVNIVNYNIYKMKEHIKNIGALKATLKIVL